MKTNILKTVLFTGIIISLFSSCTKDGDYELQTFKPMLFSEDFSVIPDNSTSLTQRGWTLFNEAGTVSWFEEEHSHDAYAKFSGYLSGETSNIGWLISPSINMDNHDGEKLLFQAAQAYVKNSANTLEVFISSDYDGNVGNVLTSTWTPLTYNKPGSVYFEYASSEIDLSSYTGNIYIAFKVKGSATLSGTYQIDNVRVIY